MANADGDLPVRGVQERFGVEICMRYENESYDEERALYGSHDIVVSGCSFDGPADGESALKECKDIVIEKCNFRLRYPLWHVQGAVIRNSVMTETCRAALWYDKNVEIFESSLGGIKALRECKDCTLTDCEIVSPEFGWKCSDISLKKCKLQSEYVFLETKKLYLDNVDMKGKYSFQYVEDALIENSILDTKDAFWHSKNITVRDSVVKGEYLAWYSENLHLIRCKVIGTQPLCYAKGLVLEECEMIDTDLAFEYSDVKADICSHIISVKNPVSGYVKAKSIGEIILDEHQKAGASCVITCEENA